MSTASASTPSERHAGQYTWGLSALVESRSQNTFPRSLVFEPFGNLSSLSPWPSRVLINHESLKGFMAAIGTPTTARCWRESLGGVLVLTPDAFHAEHTLAAIECDLAMLVEKPIARTLSDAEEIYRQADARGVPLMCVANKRHSPPYRRAKAHRPGASSESAAVRSQVQPWIRLRRSTRGRDGPSVRPRTLFDGHVQRLSAVGVNKYGQNRVGYPIDSVVISFDFISGAVRTLYTCLTALSLKPWERVEVYGKHAWLAVDDQYTLLLHGDEVGPAHSWTPVAPNTLLFNEEWGGYLPLLDNFLQTLHGNAQPIATGRDGYRALELIAATHLALARQEPASLPLDPATADAEVATCLERGRQTS
jgi:predicted dehydrogenase